MSGGKPNVSRVLLGSAVLLGTVFPQVVAYAAPPPSPIETVTAGISGDLITAEARHVPGVSVDYAFFSVSAADIWRRLRTFGPGDTITWIPPGGGFRVAVLALTPYQVEHHDWSQVVFSPLYPIAPPPVSTVRIEGSAGSDVPESVPVTLSAAAYDAAGRRLVDPGAATWSVTGGEITPQDANTAVLVAGSGGQVAVTATIGGKSTTRTFGVYAQPTAVTLQIASSNLTVGDQAQVTVDVLDPSGIDAGFSGTVEISDSVPELVAPGGGPLANALSGPGGDAVTVTDGVGHFSVQGGPSAGTVQSLSASHLSVPPGDAVSYGSATITVAPVPPPIPANVSGLAYQQATVTSPGQDVVSTDPVVTTQQGASIPDTGTYTLSGPANAAGVSLAADGTIGVAAGALDGVYTVTYSQGSASESVDVLVDLPLGAPTLDGVSEVSGGIRVAWSPGLSAGGFGAYEIWGTAAAPSGSAWGTAGPSTLLAVVPSTDTTWTVTGGLVPGDRYTVDVVAYAAAGAESSASATASATYGATVEAVRVGVSSGTGGPLRYVQLLMDNALASGPSAGAILVNGATPLGVSVDGQVILISESMALAPPWDITDTGFTDLAGNPATVNVVVNSFP